MGVGTNTKTPGTILDLSHVADLTEEEQRRIAHEAEWVLAALASVNNMLKQRRAGSSPKMEETLAAVQCAALRFYFEIIPNEGYGVNQTIFDTALQHFRKVATDG